MILAGIPDPLRQLPDLHAFLDVTEMLLTESMDKKQIDQFNMRMYRPEPGRKPEGFSREEQLSSFDAFDAMAGDLR